MKTFDVIVISGGQSGLAMGNYLRRTGLFYLILDNQVEPGGAWPILRPFLSSIVLGK